MTPGEAVSVASFISTLVLVGWQARGFRARIDAADERMNAHEELCGERYQRIEQTQHSLVERSDERHKENVVRLDKLDSKLDRVLEARRR